MTYSFQEHTADVRMNVESKNVPALSLKGGRSSPPRGKLQFSSTPFSAYSPSSQCHEVFCARNKETYESVQLEALHSNALRAKFLGHRISSFGDDIKAVTYREAKIEKDAAGIWHAHLIFDM